MICDPCERQLAKPGKHRRHRGCHLNVIAGSCAGPCWCPACHPISASYEPPDMSVAAPPPPPRYAPLPDPVIPTTEGF